MSRPLAAAVDLAAIQHNLATVRDRAPGCPVLAVVKADAYGHGAVPVAQALQHLADGYAVASVSEAETLRAAGITGPVMVLGGAFDGEDAAAGVAMGLDLVVHSNWQLDLLADLPAAPAIRIWLKVDSGMHRLGLEPVAVPACLARARQLACVAEIGLMSHLACADTPDHPDTARQLAAVAALTAAPELAGLPLSLCHSAGVLTGLARTGEHVRPGIMLWGATPVQHRSAADLGLRPAMALRSRVVALRDLPAGATVGYGAAFRSDRPTRLAVVAGGYGDGYPRHAGNGTPVLVAGQRAQLAGRVSMDLVTVDVTDVPAAAVGSEVEFWGPGLPADEIAAAADTIAYDLFTAVTARVPRLYSH